MTTITNILPADLGPKPVHASGMFKLSKDFTGTAITLRRVDTGAQADFSFGPDGKLPLAAMDAFRNNAIVGVFVRADQMGGSPSRDYVVGTGNMPKFGALTLGGHRCMWLESDCQTANVAPTGTINFMRADNVAPLNVAQNAMTVMQVVQLHNSAYCNQMSGAFRGTLFATDVFTTGLMPGTRIYSEFNSLTIPNQMTAGGFTVENGDGFRMQSVNAWLETTPIVMTYITGPQGTFIGQNEDFRSISAHTTQTPIAQQFFIGCNEASVAGGFNEAMGMAETATLVWNQTLTMAQAAAVRAALYDLAGINRLHSHSNKPLIVIFSDSIWAGYKGDDLRGWDKRAALQLPSDVRWANFAVPGASLIHNPATPYPSYGATTWYPGFISQAIRQHRGRVHCLWGAAVNDFYDGTITPQFVYDTGYVPLINMIRATDPSATITLVPGMRSSNLSTDQHFADTSALIRSGASANHYGIVDLAGDPVMGNPNDTNVYKDGTHLGNVGCDRMATLITPTLANWLQSLGPY